MTTSDYITLFGELAEVDPLPEHGRFTLVVRQYDEFGNCVSVELDSELVERIIGGDF